MDKCRFTYEGADISIKPDGINELDPCEYEEIQCLRNVTVHVLKCRNCGHVEISWERQENTEEIFDY